MASLAPVCHFCKEDFIEDSSPSVTLSNPLGTCNHVVHKHCMVVSVEAGYYDCPSCVQPFHNLGAPPLTASGEVARPARSPSPVDFAMELGINAQPDIIRDASAAADSGISSPYRTLPHRRKDPRPRQQQAAPSPRSSSTRAVSWSRQRPGHEIRLTNNNPSFVFDEEGDGPDFLHPNW